MSGWRVIPQAVRSAMHRTAGATGLNASVAKSRWRQQRLLVWCYHGVSLDDEHEWSALYVSPSHLEHRITLLRKMGANVLPFDEAVTRLYSGDLPECAVALTFDDGAHDFSSKAYPILTATSTPATLYLTTWHVNRPYPVFNTMSSYLLWKGRGQTLRIPGIDITLTIPSSVTDEHFLDLHLRVRQFAEKAGWSAQEKLAYLRTLAALVRVDFDRLLELRLLQLMTPAEVAALDSRLVQIELHTHRHRTPRTHDEFIREIVDNQQGIEAYSGVTGLRRHFCYPSGDYVPEYASWLREQGVFTGTTCDPGIASARHDPYFIPRVIDAETMPDETFRSWVSGVAAFTSASALRNPNANNHPRIYGTQ